MTSSNDVPYIYVVCLQNLQMMINAVYIALYFISPFIDFNHMGFENLQVENLPPERHSIGSSIVLETNEKLGVH